MTENLAILAQEVGDQLKQINACIATAESCTAGGLGYWLTSPPGSSAWFERGFITYSNQAKMDMLGVPVDVLTQFGAVSEETAIAMAEGALIRSNADLSLAITGLAGPGGGSISKPIGTVWLAIAMKGLQTRTELKHFSGSRETIRLQSISHALQFILTLINVIQPE